MSTATLAVFSKETITICQFDLVHFMIAFPACMLAPAQLPETQKPLIT